MSSSKAISEETLFTSRPGLALRPGSGNVAAAAFHLAPGIGPAVVLALTERETAAGRSCRSGQC